MFSRTVRRFLNVLTGCLVVPSLAFGQFDGASEGTDNAPFDLDAAATDLASSCVALPDGKVVVAGSATDDDGEARKIALARFTTAGLLDEDFGVDGFAVIDQSDLGFPFTDAAATAVARQADRIVVAGYRNDPGNSVFQPFLLRLHLDGSIDGAFGSSGWLLPTHIQSVTDMEVSPWTLDIWLVGPETDGIDGRYWLIKVDPQENELFAAFVFVGVNGFVLDLELTPDGKAIVVGAIDNESVPGIRMLPLLRRYLANGGPDPAIGLGSGGWAYDYGDSRLGRSVGILPNGRMVLQGTFGAFAAEDLFVTWLADDGQYDPAIGSHTVGFDLGGTGGDGSLGASQMVVQSDGKVVVAARALTGAAPGNFADIGVARFGAAGGLDASFGGAGTGKRTFELWTPGTDGDDYNSCLTLANGKLVVSGSSHFGADDWDFALQRLSNALIFTDGVELGSTGFWSATTP